MDKIKEYYLIISKRCEDNKKREMGIELYWKIIISFYLFVFIALLILGWVFYSWAISSDAEIPKTKNIRAEITIDDVNKAREITEQRKNRLDEVIKMDVKAVEMR